MQKEAVVFLKDYQFGDEDPTKYSIRYKRQILGSCCGIQVICDISICALRFDAYYEEDTWMNINFTSEATSVKQLAFQALNDHLTQPTLIKLKAEGKSYERSNLPEIEHRPFNAGIIVAADYVKLRGKNTNGYYTREYCENADWTTDGLVVKNPNSSNHVQFWSTIVTPKVKVNPNYIVSEVHEVTNESLANA